MKNKGIIVFLIVLAIVIIAVIAGDFISTRPDKQSGNPYEYNMDQFKEVDPKLIMYRETKNFRIGMDSLRGLAFNDGLIFVVGDNKLKIIDQEGRLINESVLVSTPSCIQVGNGKIMIGFGKSIGIYNMDGTLFSEWPPFDEKSVITSIAIKNDQLFIADAGKRIVYRYLLSGEKIGEFEGKTGDEVLHGFIVPSPNFDLAFNADGELWVVNPGNHSLENYTDEGVLRGFWKKSSMEIEGFSGCCNPAHIAFMPDGNFLTSEKGIVRIKIYKPSGELIGVVAPPAKFTDEGHAPDVSVDESGIVYAADPDKQVIRIFEPLKE